MVERVPRTQSTDEIRTIRHHVRYPLGMTFRSPLGFEEGVLHDNSGYPFIVAIRACGKQIFEKNDEGDRIHHRILSLRPTPDSRRLTPGPEVDGVTEPEVSAQLTIRASVERNPPRS